MHMALPAPQTLSLDIALKQAIAHHEAGRLPEAEQLYRAILQAQPDHAEGNYGLGMIACQIGQFVGALPYLNAALAANPSHPQFALTYAEALLAVGQPQEAQKTLNSMNRERYSAAAQSLRKKIGAALPEHASPVGMTAAAETNQLIAQFNAGQFAALEHKARYLLKNDSNSGFVWQILGAALEMQGKDGLYELKMAAQFLPNDAGAHNNLGKALRDHGQFDDAVASYRQALAIKPDFAVAHSGFGMTLRCLGQIDAALASYRQALLLKPDYVEAYNNIGRALLDFGQQDEAISHLRRALEIKPDYPEVHNNLLMALQYVPSTSSDELFAAHRHFGEQFEAALKPNWRVPANDRDPGKRLKIGYVSGDFRMHPVAYFIEPVLANHDKSQVEVFCYSNSARHDTFTDRLIAEADHWLACFGMSDDQLAQRIRSDGIDILVDLSGHTARNRLMVFARKPAPVQITYLGYPGTSGLSAMDYRLTDRYAEPGSDQYYTEKLLRLPDSLWCYSPVDDMPEVTPLPALANGYVTFGSFNNVNKVGSECIVLWAKLLRSLPTARLMMATVPEGEMRTRLVGQFREHGVEDERLEFCGKLPLKEFQRKLQQVDVSLDPFPVNGATTTCESLWLGVPVLSLVGDRFLSRAGLSVLSAAHMPEFAVATPEEYVSTAALLASDLPQLAKIRAGMRERLKTTPLFDQRRFTRNLEGIYRDVWRKYALS